MRTESSFSRRGALFAMALFACFTCAAGSVTSCTWLQNVGTDRFTVMCETKSRFADLRLQYWPQGSRAEAKS